VRAALAELARSLHRECGGRTVRAPNLHLTLAFLGDVPVRRVADLVTVAEAIGGSPFELAIDTHDYWRHNRIVWAGAAQCPSPLRDLVARLGRGLQAAGFQCEARDYAPHITLLRDARRAPVSQFAGIITWRASEFALVRSARRDGALVYEIVTRWLLGCALNANGIMHHP
jgi:2'-5' RNA ligase